MNYKKIITISLCLLLLLVTGCSKVPKLENGKELVVEMKGINITVDDLYAKMKDRYARDILVDMIDELILEKEYETDEEITQQVNGQIEYIKMQTGENFLLAIKSQWGLNSEQELFDYLKISFKRNKAVEDYTKTLIKDKDIEKYYKDKTVGDITASHILIKPKVTDDMPSDEKKVKEDEALSLAKDLIKQLNNGAKFADLAKQYSDDEGSAANGGELGWFGKGKMVESFENAAFKLVKGKYTTVPVKSDFGYHIILKTDEKEKPALEDARDNIIDTLVNEKINEDTSLQYTALEKLRKKYNLVIHDSNLDKQYSDYLKELKAQ